MNRKFVAQPHCAAIRNSVAFFTGHSLLDERSDFSLNCPRQHTKIESAVIIAANSPFNKLSALFRLVALEQV